MIEPVEPWYVYYSSNSKGGWMYCQYDVLEVGKSYTFKGTSNNNTKATKISDLTRDIGTYEVSNKVLDSNGLMAYLFSNCPFNNNWRWDNGDLTE